MSAAEPWKPYDSLTKAPTNLKEAIDWVLRVTGKDGKENDKSAASPPKFGCLCFLAKAVKDLLYDAKDPGSTGPTTDRYWDDILLEQEKGIVKPVLTDLGLLSSTSATSTNSTCAGGTEVIKALIDHLAQGLQKWVGWQDKGDDCCLKGGSGESKGIGRKCDCNGSVGAGCCNGGKTCHECTECGTGAKGGPEKKCYQSAYSKTTALWTTIVNGTTGGTTNVKTVQAAQEVHLLARIFLGSVCLIWSGLSQLGFLTGKGSGAETRWKESELSKISDDDSSGLGSFMAAMGYDLERLNGSGGDNKDGTFVWKLLSGQEPSDDKGKIKWQEFASVKSKTGGSVAEYYSSIYDKAQKAKGSTTEKLCEQYPLLVLHILASGYFRAGSAGAKGVTTPAKPASTSAAKKENTPRKPRTIREILYWLSALPYSQGYCGLVTRIQAKYPPKEGVPNETVEQIELYNEGASKASTTLKRKDITHYLMAACGYCPLVLIGIQGTIEREVTQAPAQGPGDPAAAAQSNNKCPEHSKDRNHRCIYKEDTKTPTPTPAAPPAPAAGNGKPLEKGQVCYGGYHLEVKDFGPLHGMYANGLFGFDLDGSPAQCLDQLRVYVYHCFYQLYFLRKQCTVGVVNGSVLGWQSCRYGYQVSTREAKNNRKWTCDPLDGGGDQKCKCLGDGASQGPEGSKDGSPLQSFLCDSIYGMNCQQTVGRSLEKYPEIDAHMNKTIDKDGKEHEPHRYYPQLCPVPMGWQSEGSKTSGENHFKDLTQTHKQESLNQGSAGTKTYPVHCTGNTLSHLLEYYCDPEKCHGSLVLVLRLLACITPTVPRTLGDLFGFYYYIVYIGGNSASGGQGVYGKLKGFESSVRLGMIGTGDKVVGALTTWSSGGNCSSGGCKDTLKCLYGGGAANKCTPFISPLSGQQYGQLSHLMAGTYLSWLVYLIGEFQDGLKELETAFKKVDCKGDNCKGGAASGAAGCGGDTCKAGSHGTMCSSGGSDGVCKCPSVVSCTGVLPVLYKYGFGYGDVNKLHTTGGVEKKQCHEFLGTLEKVLEGNHLKNGSNIGLHHEINKLIYTTRLPWIFVLTLAWLVAVLYLAFGAIWPLDWAHMRSHCRGWFRKGSLSPWEILMVGKKKGRGILEFFGKT